MRWIYTLVIALVIFNAVLAVFAPLFPNQADSDLGRGAVDITSDSDFSKYKDVGNIASVITGLFTNITTLVIFLIITGGSTIIGFVTGGAKNIPLSLGIGLFISVTAGLFGSTIVVFAQFTRGIQYVSELFTIVTIVIAIIFVFTVGETLMNQRGVDA